MSRRNRGGEPDVSAPAADEAENEWCVICPGSTSCFFGTSGEAFPAFAVSDPWCTLQTIPDVLYAENAPHKMKRFAEYLRAKSRRLVITVPATCDDSTRLRLCSSVFERTGAVAVALLSEAVACSFACGKTDGVTVLDLGWSHTTASFVECGRTVKFASSRTLSLRNFFTKQVQERVGDAAAMNSAKDRMHVLAGTELQKRNDDGVDTGESAAALEASAIDEAIGSEDVFNVNRGRILKFYTAPAAATASSSSLGGHLAQLCNKMPLRALQQFPILLAGGGGGCEGLGSKLSQIVRGVVAHKIEEGKAQDDGDDDDRSDKRDEDDDDDDSSSGSSSAAASSDSNSDDDDGDKPRRKKSAMKRKRSNAVDSDLAKKVNIGTIIRVRSDAARLFVFRGASLVASTGVFEEIGAVSLEDWRTTIENAGGASVPAVVAGSAVDAVAAPPLRSWSSMSESEREALQELVSWRFPM